jgi:hypothetical protein
MNVANEYPVQIYEMMARLGIQPSAAVLPQHGLRYATALRSLPVQEGLPGLARQCAGDGQLCAVLLQECRCVF